MKWLRDLLTYEPALVAWTVNGGLAVLLTFIFHLGSTQSAAVTTLATALATVYTAWKARPVAVATLTGTLVTGVTAAGAFGLHLPATVIATAAALLANVLALVLRANLTPITTLTTQRQATTLQKYMLQVSTPTTSGTMTMPPKEAPPT